MRWAFLLPFRQKELHMCDERLALFHRYNSLTMEHARRVSIFSGLADESLKNRSLRDQLDKSLLELEGSRQAVQDARQQLKQHTAEHHCDQFPGLHE
jgi:hypothetical protein